MTTLLASLLAASSSQAQASPFGGESGEEDRTSPAPNEIKTPPSSASGAFGRRPRERRWYGEQILIADGGSILAFTLGAVSDWSAAREAFMVTGVVSYAITPSLIHLVHGHPGKAVGGFFLRLGMPTVTASIGGFIALAAYSPPPSRSDGDGSGAFGDALGSGLGALGAFATGAAIGAGVGVAGAIAIDSAAIAREDAPQKTDSTSSASGGRSLQWSPVVAPNRGGMSAGIVGIF